MKSDLNNLRGKLRTEMPVTRHMGIRVVRQQGGGVLLRAPLAANVNHKGTAFAGSLNATATLAGWCTVWLLLREHNIDGHCVIQDSSVRYARPVCSDFEARVEAPAEDVLTRFFHSIRRRGRGRIELSVTVADRRGVAVHFRGRYVVGTDLGVARDT
jgi:thioesterase domain-containing protein